MLFRSDVGLERAVLQMIESSARAAELVIATGYHVAISHESGLDGNGVVDVVGYEENSHARIAHPVRSPR